ncbi:three-finger toxin MALT0070C-like [Acanthopagrus latus]|uniref:three-finger toxin MALT0070C-like n=1 Tax=Acanthopagrus latus TaxID=8177 RepID=UPI00187C3C93|nr:three-finger toxin MALT0070C-like [Acanthopagrus latus]
MQLYGVLVLMVTMSAACGLRCYTCADTNIKACTDILDCPAGNERCSSVEVDGVITKACLNSGACVGPAKCCDTDLCNGAIPAGSSVLLLLVSSAITSVFL